MYNFDEKRFVIGVGITIAQVMTLEEIRSGEIIGANQDGSRKWVSLLAIVYTVAMKIPLLLIYQVVSRGLGDSQVKDVRNNTVYFAVTHTG